MTKVEPISASEPDWSREAISPCTWNPGRALLRSIRRYQRCAKSRNPLCWIVRKFAVIEHAFWSLISGADIPLNSSIGGGLLIPHPNGIVIYPHAIIGPNCIIFQQVTIGSNDTGKPTIGGHVDIGAGAKIIGGLTIGDHAKVGANAVVIKDVPAHATAVGVPARIIQN